MKRIVFTATDSGVDGRERTTDVYAAWTEEERDAMIAKDKNKNWRGKREAIIDPEVIKKQALGKLDGIEKLVLDIQGFALLKEAVNWVLNDAQYKAPEAINHDVTQRWLSRLADGLKGEV